LSGGEGETDFNECIGHIEETGERNCLPDGYDDSWKRRDRWVVCIEKEELCLGEGKMEG